MYYADVDYLAASNDQRSVPGVAVLLGSKANDWKGIRKKCVTTAICEAGNPILCDASKASLFTKAVLIFLQPEMSAHEYAYTFGDNEGSKANADNPSSTSRRKHIDDVKLHFNRGLIRKGEGKILHVETEEQHTEDVLMKAFWRKKILFRRSR